MTILQMLRASFDVCKSLPRVSSSIRFFSVSQAACEPSRKDLNAKLMKRRETNRRASKSSSFRCQIDPEYRRHERARGLEAERRYTQNPEHREAIRSRKREAYIRHKNRNPHFYTKHRLREWLHKHAWVRDELDWKAHKPVVSPVKVARTCASCNIEQYGGFQLWWSCTILHTRTVLISFLGGQQRKYDPSLFDCTTCYFGPGPDPRQAWPRGCEDVTTLRELRIRKQELDLGLDPGSLSQTKSSDVKDIQS
ncbi:uncharacterized protein M437DRAFT_66377 [Aureobasidium melanogenum CBS 110374]|uniref:Uncharacterized protein n=1 Tax=Aureobasidium melanogenum (strain CBS 110374) TaxID=1043003 RepID=A0A074VP76_AURM1|nr:uncharacterized protein M437DRAFT_66377 [Aureobasidium melanogenum CBS 110374]KEQ62515.1 hypothetical protein M437DRAFT_66377 [Aureobasidium melanogenum CBS 110374]